MFGKEPAVVLGALAEIIKAVIPMLIIFGFIQWTGEQVAQVMIVVGVVVGGLNIVLTRSQVRPEGDVNALIRTATEQTAGTSPEVVKEIQAAKEGGQ